MINAWLIYDSVGAKTNQDYIRMHMDIGRKYDISFRLVIADDVTDISRPREGDKPRFAIVRTIQPGITRLLESFHIPTFNDSHVSEIANHKGKAIRYIESNTDVPAIPTMTFDNHHLCADLLSRYPHHVIKSVDGHGGKQVFMTDDSLEDIRGGIGESDFVIQPFVDGPGKDVRFYIIGDRIVGAIERRACSGFRSNYSLGGEVHTYVWSDDDICKVDKICSLFSFGLVGIDFIVSDNGDLMFNEIEDVVGARMLYQCRPDIALLQQYFTFILDNTL